MSLKTASLKSGDHSNQRRNPDTNMYTEGDVQFSQSDLKRRKRLMEEELTIFAPHASEFTSLIEPENQSKQGEKINLERPVTPIDVGCLVFLLVV